MTLVSTNQILASSIKLAWWAGTFQYFCKHTRSQWKNYISEIERHTPLWKSPDHGARVVFFFKWNIITNPGPEWRLAFFFFFFLKGKRDTYPSLLNDSSLVISFRKCSTQKTFSRSTAAHNAIRRVLTAGPTPVPILVIFGRSLLIFCLKALGKYGKWHHFVRMRSGDRPGDAKMSEKGISLHRI